MPISCHFWDCKVLLNMCSSWSSTISSTWPLPFTFTTLAIKPHIHMHTRFWWPFSRWTRDSWLPLDTQCSLVSNCSMHAPRTDQTLHILVRQSHHHRTCLMRSVSSASLNVPKPPSTEQLYNCLITRCQSLDRKLASKTSINNKCYASLPANDHFTHYWYNDKT